jgi:hypothetical protein
MKTTQDKQETQFSSNAIRLQVREWLITAGIIILIAVAFPPVWRSLEGFSLPVDYRVSYEFSEDYWLYKHYCRSECDQAKTMVIGDSVVWGHYVGRDQTLSHYLNELAGEEQFVNLGLDGTHPMALYGLVRHYGRAIKGEKVILHLNLLWLSSQEADLQTDKEFQFNHPRLVPQFRPWIPCYTEQVSGRVGIVLERFMPLFQIVQHLQISSFDSTNLQLWTVENPYSNPFSRIKIRSIGRNEEREGDNQSGAQPKDTRTQILQSLPWVEFEKSLQWWAFQHLLELLMSRDNDVFVVVGPMNEHVLNPDSLQQYSELLFKAERYLELMNVRYLRLPLLPSHLYADTSHPISQGYALLAEHIWNRLK